jgi:diguanylate cyclase
MLETAKLYSDKPSQGGDSAGIGNDPTSLASRALRLAEAYNTPPVPKIYEIWYAFAAGQPDRLCHEIRKLIDTNGTVSSYELDQLHHEFLSASEAQRQEHELAGYHLDREMHKAIGLVQRHIGSNDRFAGSLKKSANAMTATANPARLQQAVESLLLENGRMRAESVKLGHSLDQIRVEVRKLSARLEKARQNEFKDPLTNVANRRYFDRALPKFIADAVATGSPLNLVMADLDHFKLVNDTFGHQVGDDVLRYFAALLQKNVKGRDIVARYGGEEFAIILPSTTGADAKLLMQQIMAQLERANLVISKDRNPIGKMTSSFGIAQARRGDDAETLIKRADEKLYEAKQAGRNRIACDTE